MLRYAITDRALTLSAAQVAHERFVRKAAEVARDGVDFLLIREQDLAAGELAQLCRQTTAAIREVSASTQILVAGRADVAVAAGANGVHLSARAGELSVEQVRLVFRMIGAAEPFVSVACHSLDDVHRARETGASAILFAPVFSKIVRGTLVAAGVGLDCLRAACAAAGSLPVFALGGVTGANAAECVAAGAAGVAGIRMFFAPAVASEHRHLT